MLRLCQLLKLVLTIARTLPDWKPEPFPNGGGHQTRTGKITQLSKQI